MRPLTGADRFIVATPLADTASLTGGTLNISYISGYTPAVNDTLRILQATGGVTLNAGAVTLAGNPGWSLITDLTTTHANPVEIRWTRCRAWLGGGSS